MKDYLADKTSLPIPWVESPFFYSLLQDSDLTDKEKKLKELASEKEWEEVDKDEKVILPLSKPTK